MVNPLPQDNLEADLRLAINDGLGDMGINNAVDFGPLLQRLVILAVARDHKVFDHGHKLGREQWAKMIAGKYGDLPLQHSSNPAFVMRWLDSYADFKIPGPPKLNNDKIGAKP